MVDKEKDLVKLVEIRDNYQLSIVKGLLKDNEIPYILKDYEIGGYMRIIVGSSIYPTEILVSSEDLERAREILDSIS